MADPEPTYVQGELFAELDGESMPAGRPAASPEIRAEDRERSRSSHDNATPAIHGSTRPSDAPEASTDKTSSERAKDAWNASTADPKLRSWVIKHKLEEMISPDCGLRFDTRQIGMANVLEGEKAGLIALETGGGKTTVLLFRLAMALTRNPEGQALITTPEGLLVNQLARAARKVLELEPEQVIAVSGALVPDPAQRREMYEREGVRAMFATPEIVFEDLKAGVLSFERFEKLCLFGQDEFHHATGWAKAGALSTLARKLELDRIAVSATPADSDTGFLERVVNFQPTKFLEWSRERRDLVIHKPVVTERCQRAVPALEEFEKAISVLAKFVVSDSRRASSPLKLQSALATSVRGYIRAARKQEDSAKSLKVGASQANVRAHIQGMKALVGGVSPKAAALYTALLRSLAKARVIEASEIEAEQETFELKSELPKETKAFTPAEVRENEKKTPYQLLALLETEIGKIRHSTGDLVEKLLKPVVEGKKVPGFSELGAISAVQQLTTARNNQSALRAVNRLRLTRTVLDEVVRLHDYLSEDGDFACMNRAAQGIAEATLFRFGDERGVTHRRIDLKTVKPSKDLRSYQLLHGNFSLEKNNWVRNNVGECRPVFQAALRHVLAGFDHIAQGTPYEQVRRAENIASFAWTAAEVDPQVVKSERFYFPDKEAKERALEERAVGGNSYLGKHLARGQKVKGTEFEHMVLQKESVAEPKGQRELLSETLEAIRKQMARREGYGHPKEEELQRVVLGHFNFDPEAAEELGVTEASAEAGRLITTAKFVEQTRYLHERLEYWLEKHGVAAVPLVGDGMSMKEQTESMRKLGEGEARVLAANCKAYEGLNVPAATRMVRYNALSSPTQDTQSRGRLAREQNATGHLHVLLAGDSKEPGRHWSGFHRRRQVRDMYREADKLLQRALEEVPSLSTKLSRETHDDVPF